MIRNIGELRYKIAFQEPIVGRVTASGYRPVDWSTWREDEPAAREETGGTESTQAGGRNEALRVTWTVRKSVSGRNPTVTDKILHRGVVYNIDAVNDPDGKERQLEIQSTQLAVIANA